MRRVVFMGTPDFAVPTLASLQENKYQLVGVVTQPDRPKGRGQKLAASPVKEFALAHGLPVYQPERVKEPGFVSQLRALAPDVIVVVAYGQILSAEILTLPPYGCINVHASLLPKYRGAAPIHWAVINGETVTGVTTMHMDRGMDTGDMILKAEVPITCTDTTGSLHDKLAPAGARLLLQTLQQAAAGTAPREKQDGTQATYAPLLKREHERLDWGRTAQVLDCQIRGLNPWPGAFTTHRDRRLKVWRAVPLAEGTGGLPGTVRRVDREGIVVATAGGSLRLVELQPQNSKRMTATDYARGQHIEAGEQMGV
ncbi:MAG TPA: methionyl-tRNA formyltransferase [Negativicutes bacterium]|nr:methionyl-tRNA formyltransferase [Negativicutes bacterium]